MCIRDSHYISLLRKDFTEYCGQKLSEQGLSQGLLYFILYIGKHPGCSPGELSRSLQMDAGHSTRSLTRLEETGFILRQANPADKRSCILELTDKGQDAFDLSHDLFDRWEAEAVRGLTQEEHTQLLALLRRILPGERKEPPCMKP